MSGFRLAQCYSKSRGRWLIDLIPPGHAGIFDSDRSGFISFSEFEGLWAYIKDWHKIFLRFDRYVLPSSFGFDGELTDVVDGAAMGRDNSGTIDRGELDQALQSFGYPLPRDLVRKLEKRFGR